MLKKKTIEIMQSPLFVEVMNCLTEDDAVGMAIRLEELGKDFPQHPVHLLYSAFSREMLEKEEEAFELYNAAARAAVVQLEYDPHQFLRETACMALCSVAEYYGERCKPVAALGTTHRAIQICHSMARPWLLLADCRKNQGDMAGAVEALHEALTRDTSPHIYWCLGITAAALCWPAEAVRAFHQGTRHNPEDDDLWVALSRAYTALNLFPEAASALKRALDLQDNEDALLLNNYAYLLCKCGRSRAALKVALHVAALVPGAPAAWDTLSYAYIGTQEYEKAIDAALTAVDLNWDEHEAWYHLGVAYARNNQPDKAREVFNQLLRLDLAWAGLLSGEIEAYASDSCGVDR